jgi:hypothetical protein
MQFLWMLVPYLLPAAILAVPLALIAAIDVRVRQLGKAVRACDAAIQSEAAQLTNAVNDLKRMVTELESKEGARSDGEPQEAGLSDLARGKVLKMHRVGRASEQIAETLGLPKGEVDLLIKVHKIVMQPYEGLAPAAKLRA